MKAIIDLHTHTINSGHAYSTLQENIVAAKNVGLKYLGISDHAPNMPGGAHKFFFDNLQAVPSMIEGIRVFKGVEINILDGNGSLDLPESTIKKLDYVIASLHGPCYSHDHTLDENMSAYISACNNPYVRIIGHPDDGRYPIDYDLLAKTAKETNTILEVNCSSLKPNSFRLNGVENTRKMIEACKIYNTLIIVNSDAHHSSAVGKLDNGLSLLKEMNFPKDLIINYKEELIIKLFDKQ
ncbi:MAG: phosphatase [Erysipelotrichaceae bacterium]|nr:phosphatase [Erysipelotrichaceae bacterium]